ncbi:MAG: amino acid-binding protein [Methanobacteriota archaeon]|nr:MAG: amino acid-binding protein [Euryarchaeota archaeon]
MWKKIEAAFRDFPAQRRVAAYLLEKGFQVKENGKIACDGCDVPSTSIGRRLGVDRRVVDSTAKRILEDEELKRVYGRLSPVAFLRDVAPEIGLGVISISVKDASVPGIIEQITDCIARNGVSIRQAIAEDPYFSSEPKFTVITAERIQGSLVEELKNIEGINQITIY